MRDIAEDIGDKRAADDRVRWLDHPSQIGWSELAWRDRPAATSDAVAPLETADGGSAPVHHAIEGEMAGPTPLARSSAAQEAGATSSAPPPAQEGAPIFPDATWQDAAYPPPGNASLSGVSVPEATPASPATPPSAPDAAAAPTFAGPGAGVLSSGQNGGAPSSTISAPNAADDAPETAGKPFGADWSGGARLDIDFDVDVSQSLVFTQDLFIDVTIDSSWFDGGAGRFADFLSDLAADATASFELEDWLVGELFDPLDAPLGPQFMDLFNAQFPLDAFDAVNVDVNVDVARDILLVRNTHIDIEIVDGSAVDIDALSAAKRDAVVEDDVSASTQASTPVVDEGA